MVSQKIENFKTSIGGQALIEGIMMIGPEKKALAVRLPSGEIKLEMLPQGKASRIEKIPFLRGSVKLVRQMVLGIKAMYRSADLSEILEEDADEPAAVEGSHAAERCEVEMNIPEQETSSSATTAEVSDSETGACCEAEQLISKQDSEPDDGAENASKASHDDGVIIQTEASLCSTQAPAEGENKAEEAPSSFHSAAPAEEKQTSEAAEGTEDDPKTPEKSEKKASWLDRHPDVFMAFTTVLALGLSVLLFFLLPNAITEGLRRLFALDSPTNFGGQFALNLVEGALRIAIFVIYLALTRRQKEIKRVWMYHGSEHKTIACYEAGEELTVENVSTKSRFHPRCGTSFMFLVMFVAILVFSLVGWYSPLINALLRVLLLPVIAGISYEIIKWAGRSDSCLASWISKPGLLLQRLTTAEPDAAIIEVAIVAMKAVIPGDQSDRW